MARSAIQGEIMAIFKCKRSAGILVIVAIATTMISPGSALPLAATTRATWTIRPGGKVTGVVSSLTLKDTKTGRGLTCKTSTTTATLKSGSGQASPLGSITSLVFSTCTGLLGSSFTVTVDKLPYKLNGTTYNPATGMTIGAMPGMFDTIKGSGCSASVAGKTATSPGHVTATYTNSTSTLKFSGGNLHIWNVSGHVSHIADGDPVTLTATYTVSPKQTITSP
jgi:uncharacterized cupin superfamily protein